jgi:hypothetical protein
MLLDEKHLSVTCVSTVQGFLATSDIDGGNLKFTSSP